MREDETMKKIIIFGASSTGISAMELLKKEYDIIGFSDNNCDKWNSYIKGKKIFPPKDLVEMENVEIIIASVYYAAISKQLRQLGITKIKIFYCYGAANYSNISDVKYDLFEIGDVDLFRDCVYHKKEMKKKCIKNVHTSKKKKVLFCAYIFPPLGESGVQRSLKFVKYLQEHDFEPIVLTVGNNNGKIGYDYTLLDEVDKNVQVIRIDEDIVLPEMLSLDDRQNIYDLYAGLLKDKEDSEELVSALDDGKGFLPDNSMIWVNECLKKIDDVLDLQDIDVIYTTGAPFSCHILGYYLKKKTGIPWVQDYRDPWLSNDYYLNTYKKISKERIGIGRKIEKELVSYSDKIIVIADNLKYDYQDKYDIGTEKIIEITNGYDELDFKELTKNQSKEDKFIICYNGSIYAKRNPMPVLEAVNRLIEEGMVDKEEIVWIFNGKIEKKWMDMLLEKDIYDIIVYNGYLTHVESISRAIEADILILNGDEGEGSKYVYTGKLFEYLYMKRPILALSGAGGVIEKVLEKTQSGKNFEYTDIVGIKRMILENYLSWKKGEEVFSPRDEEIAKYSRRALTSKLAEIFLDVMK